MTKIKKQAHKRERGLGPYRWWFAGALLAGFIVMIAGYTWVNQVRAAEPKEAPEAQRVLDLQANMPFQILIPAYLPKEFDRPSMEIQVNQAGPGGEPMVQLTYRTRKGATLYVREWVPVNPEMEVLAASRPIETKWGKGWLLKQGEQLMVVWADIGPMRVSIYTYNQELVDREHLLAIAESMGPASNRQVFNFVVNPPEVREMAPPPPLEIPVNAEGVQEVDLIVTPGGYSPLRFAVKRGVPVRLSFRQLGEVGCGNELNFPIGGGITESLRLDSPADRKTLDFTPIEAGQFEFFCGHVMYRGIMTVRE